MRRDRVVDPVEERRELEVAEPWQQGNVMLIDNMLTAHARNPFVPPREIFASVAEVITEEDLPQA